jgi:hypothetical protein
MRFIFSTSDLREQLFRPVLPEPATAEIECTVAQIQQIRLVVEVFGINSDPRVGLREPQSSHNLNSTLGSACPPRYGISLAASTIPVSAFVLPLAEQVSTLNTYRADGFLGKLHGCAFVGRPLRAIPDEPLTLGRTEANAVSVLVNKSFRITAVG